MTVRSKRLAAFHQTAVASNLLYTVPAGYSTIIKELLANPYSGGTTSTYLFRIQPAGGSQQYNIVAGVNVNNGYLYRNSTWTMMEEGDELWALSTQALTDFYVSGAELLN